MKLQWPGNQALPTTYSDGLPRWRLAFAVLTVTVGAACMEGYPTQDVPSIDPLDMTQGQRLAQLNALGSEAHQDRRWNYEILPGCVLRIDLEGNAGPLQDIDVPLRGIAVTVTTDKIDDTFDVKVQPASPALGEVTVLEAQAWADAVGLARVLRVMEKGCPDE